MQLASKDPDIQTILSWISNGRIDLEPDFQRGEVWNVAKKQLLIDTILRNWQMPPVFVVIDENLMSKDVLDGHQRLTTIYHFFEGKFPVDGKLHPQRNDLYELDGLYFQDLPEKYKRRFLEFSIRIFEISNHERDEPFELFYRLNEGVKLTPAERRNTFYGALREQIKEITAYWDLLNLNSGTIGFANARLAYHDILARVLISLENGSITKKLTDKEITLRYRSERSIDTKIVQSVIFASETLSHALNLTLQLNETSSRFRRFSKPTLFSILYFLARKHISVTSHGLNEKSCDLISTLFSMQSNFAYGINLFEDEVFGRSIYDFFDFYKYRSSTSVNDARAVVIRDFFLNFLWERKELSKENELHLKISRITMQYEASEFKGEDFLYDILQNESWGEK